ncbi:outer membrane beta-barrel protein [Flavobacterium sp.]|uniref:outer membrane beta-barrel protein n=1 Tax=Flavobacterium sp. TaxID=239 RepID=UPI0031E3C3E9
MKKIYIILFLFCFLLKVSAQQTGLAFGISGGINWSLLNGQNVDSLSTGGVLKSLTGQTIGLTLDNKLSKCFGLKHEVFYSRKLMSLQLNDTLNGNYKSKFKRRYIELFPVSPVFYYKGIQLFAGPYIGILLNASLQRKNADGNLYTDKSLYGNGTTPSKYSQKMDAGFTTGLNYEFSNGIRLGGRYIQGFVPLIENANTKPQWKIYNKSFFVTIGYTFKNK